jgi:hypothetical protein
MTVEATLPPGGIVWSKCTRITALDNEGNIIPGAAVFVTDILMKATITPVNEAGDAIALKNAAGNLGVYALKGDIPKWSTVALEMVYPDAQIEALILNGTLFSDDSEAFGAPVDGPTVTVETGGSLPAGQVAYAYTGYSAFGRSLPSPLTVATADASGQNIISGFTFPAGSLGVVVYGRFVGQTQALGTVKNVGTQATSAASGTGTPASLPVTDLTAPLPAGFTFTIAGDTNTPKIVFTVTETATEGSDVVAVSSADITITIAAGDLVPVFVDNGSIKPSGVPNTTDYSGGPGIGVGSQVPAPGVANPAAFGIEFFMERIDDGHQATDYPWEWVVLPFVTYFVLGARDVTNAELQALYTGTAFPNPNFGAGPNGDFPFDTSEVWQSTACGEDVVPVPNYVAQQAGV